MDINLVARYLTASKSRCYTLDMPTPRQRSSAKSGSSSARTSSHRGKTVAGRVAHSKGAAAPIRSSPAPSPSPSPSPSKGVSFINRSTITDRAHSLSPPPLVDKSLGWTGKDKPGKGTGRWRNGQTYGHNRSRQFTWADLAPWERQPDETPEAYYCFQAYRDTSPTERGYHRVAKTLGISITTCTRHGSNHHWVERAAAWDFHIERARLQQSEQYQSEMAARHAEIAKEMLTKVRARIAKLNWKTLDPKVVAQWLDVGVKVERLSRGMAPTEISKHIVDVTHSMRTMTDQELIAEIAKEAGRRGTPQAALADAPIDVESEEVTQ